MADTINRQQFLDSITQAGKDLAATMPRVPCRVYIDDVPHDAVISNFRPAFDEHNQIIEDQYKLDVDVKGFPDIFARWDAENYNSAGIFQKGRKGRLGGVPRKAMLALIELTKLDLRENLDADKKAQEQQQEGREPQTDEEGAPEYATHLDSEPPF